MARINLLPWREKLRVQRQREFGGMALLGVLLTSAAMGYWHWHNEGLIEYQQKRNKYLEGEIRKVDKELREIEALESTKRQLISRMEVVTDLQSSRPQVVHLFDELVMTLPEGVYLTEVAQQGNRVSVLGKAQSNARVSAYMRKIEASPWLNAPALKIIEQKDGRDQSEGQASFSLDMAQATPAQEAEK